MWSARLVWLGVAVTKGKTVREMKSLRQAMLSAGWIAVDSKTNPRAYADTSGKRFGTLEKEGVRIALSIGEELVSERGAAMVYMTDDPSDAILQALIVDFEVRGKGLAKRALNEIALHANATGTTIYLEPVPIEDKPVDTNALKKLYSKFAFSSKNPGDAVMVRRPE